ncbi:J domain-containing protein [Rhodococcus sp. USK13]|uniref:J domain-containing protein n=1 Tax=Rhodococcus sp. USK13 TaxID=2806442 RepID=UPI001BCC2CC1|nr:J domain-containing protein [Rhodococcus sp. USK13]
MNTRTDFYDILGLPRTATQSEITSAYRRRLRQFHPDTREAALDTQPSDESLQHLLAAYAVLRDPLRRAEYDRQSLVAPPRAGVPPTIIRVRHHASSDPTPMFRAGPVRRHR